MIIGIQKMLDIFQIQNKHRLKICIGFGPKNV
jgi:hypothetical protein